MSGTYFCSRCGQGGVIGRRAEAACFRCGHLFRVPTCSVAAPPAYDICTAVFLYVFLPVGLMMTWTHPTWPPARKWTMTAVAATALVASFVVLPFMFGFLVLAAGLLGWRMS